jgi:hypothetical protein
MPAEQLRLLGSRVPRQQTEVAPGHGNDAKSNGACSTEECEQMAAEGGNIAVSEQANPSPRIPNIAHRMEAWMADRIMVYSSHCRKIMLLRMPEIRSQLTHRVTTSWPPGGAMNSVSLIPGVGR